MRSSLKFFYFIVGEFFVICDMNIQIKIFYISELYNVCFVINIQYNTYWDMSHK